jgi:hypothetical protein
MDAARTPRSRHHRPAYASGMETLLSGVRRGTGTCAHDCVGDADCGPGTYCDCSGRCAAVGAANTVPADRLVSLELSPSRSPLLVPVGSVTWSPRRLVVTLQRRTASLRSGQKLRRSTSSPRTACSWPADQKKGPQPPPPTAVAACFSNGNLIRLAAGLPRGAMSGSRRLIRLLSAAPLQ